MARTTEQRSIAGGMLEALPSAPRPCLDSPLLAAALHNRHLREDAIKGRCTPEHDAGGNAAPARHVAARAHGLLHLRACKRKAKQALVNPLAAASSEQPAGSTQTQCTLLVCNVCPDHMHALIWQAMTHRLPVAVVTHVVANGVLRRVARDDHAGTVRAVSQARAKSALRRAPRAMAHAPGARPARPCSCCPWAPRSHNSPMA
jgi:hypothetical protein